MRGFSLVELSIVLVILGLLTGGILAGKSLIRAFELRSIAVDYNRYITASRAFRDKYFAIPGDMTNATSFWGVLAGTGGDATCQGTAATDTATCNGDGDGVLRNPGISPNIAEHFRYWQHLANAGLIEGRYSGFNSVGGSPSGRVPGTNVPFSKMRDAFFYAQNGLGWTTNASTNNDYYAGTASLFAGNYGKNLLYFGNATGSSSVADSQPLLPEEAWNIDSKMDDGQPTTGSVMAFKGNGTNTNCTSTAGGAPSGDGVSVYLLSSSLKDCSLYFVRSF